MSLPSLAGRRPELGAAELIAGLVPPPLFAAAGFDGYRPDPAFPSQEGASRAAAHFASAAGQQAERPRRLARRKPAAPGSPPGLYLDGGFGVGKTHLLAALWHAAPGPK